jgi:hypothetical protein
VEFAELELDEEELNAALDDREVSERKSMRD